jgi:hypothetical protein
MNTLERIRGFVAKHSDFVIVRSDFARLGGEAQISRALRELLRDGTLVKIGLGVYAKTKISVLTGRLIPIKPLEVLAPIALTKLGVEIRPSRLTEEYNSGRSTQIPAGIVYRTGHRRITRKLSLNGHTVKYERG